ncbi:mucoidy inhibitor MuiA family protein [Ectothiorhodospira mobilis]|nr:mucoidy inhibitor MuiA family protein [Ectothiorhodospira mobilis]
MRSPLLPALGLLLAGLLPLQAHGLQVTAVTVHPDRARVTVQEEIRLQAGQGRIQLEELPANLDPDSLHVSARGPRDLRILAVETRRLLGDTLTHPGARALSQEIQGLKTQRRALEDRIRAQQIQLDLIQRMGPGGDPGIPPEEWPRAWETVAAGAAAALKAIREAEAQQGDVDGRIQRLEERLATWQHSGRERTQAHIHYEAPEAGDAVVTATYTVAGAGWEPVYEARLNTTDGVLELLQRARVWQGTGQDWNGVHLTLTTARADTGAVPDPVPWYLDVLPAPGETAERTLARSEAPVLLSQAREADAALEQTAFTTRFRVPGTVTLPSDNRPHRYLLARHPLQATLRARAVPALLPRAHLQAQAPFEGATPLPPGPLALFQDDALVRQDRLEMVRPGDGLELDFGSDDRIAITYRRELDLRGQEGHLRPRHTLRREHRIRVENGHDFTMPVVILDRMPVSRDERIRVEPGPEATPPTRRDLEGRPGVVAWDLELPPGGERTLHFDYTISWPADLPGIRGLGH